MKVTNGLLNSVPTLLATSGGTTTTTTTTKQRNKLPLHKTTHNNNNNHLQQNYQQQNQNIQNISQSPNFAAELVSNNYAGSSSNNMNPTIASSSSPHLPANLANNLVSLHDDDFIGSASEFIKGTRPQTRIFCLLRDRRRPGLHILNNNKLKDY